MRNKLFTERMKMAELVAANNNIILLLPRFGIRLGFGDCTVREVCAEYGIATDFFLLICNIYSFDDYLPDNDELARTDLSQLIPYLTASHRYYIDERLPHMERHLNNIAASGGDRTAQVLKRYFDDYKREVREHLEQEEKELFPYLHKLLTGDKTARSMANGFVQSHTNLKDRLSDLTQIVYKYIPGEYMTEEVVELVFGILQFAEDIEKHSIIEERLLIPQEEGELSDRETEVLVLVAKGLSSKEIAERLNLSIHTVNSHRKHITEKTGIKSVAGLTVYATLHNLIS